MSNKLAINFRYILVFIPLLISISVISFKNFSFSCNSSEKLKIFVDNKDVKTLLFDVKEFKNEYVQDSAFNIKKKPKLSQFYTSKYTYIPERKIGFYEQIHELDSITKALFFDRFYDYNISKINVVDSVYKIELDYVYTCRNTYVIDYVYKDDSFSLLGINGPKSVSQ